VSQESQGQKSPTNRASLRHRRERTAAKDRFHGPGANPAGAGQDLLTQRRACATVGLRDRTGGKILTTAKILRKCKNMAQPHLFLTRPMQNLSVRRKASLFCLHLKRRSKPIPQLSLKGIIGAGHRARWNDAESVQCANHRLPMDCTLAPLDIRTQACNGLGSLYLKTTTSPLDI